MAWKTKDRRFGSKRLQPHAVRKCSNCRKKSRTSRALNWTSFLGRWYCPRCSNQLVDGIQITADGKIIAPSRH